MPKKSQRRLFIPKSKWRDGKKNARVGEICVAEGESSANCPDVMLMPTLQDHDYISTRIDPTQHTPIEDQQDVAVSPEACAADHVPAILLDTIIEEEDGDESVVFDGLHNDPLVANEEGNGEESSHGGLNQLQAEEIKLLLPALATFLNEHPLPPNWKAEASDNGLHIMLFSRGEARVVQRSLFLSVQGDLKVFVHGVKIDQTHSVYDVLKNINLINDLEAAGSALYKVICEIRLYDVCTGVTKIKYRKFWTGTDCVVDTNAFHEIRYQTTCRSVSCLMIVPQRSRLCSACLKLQKKFSTRHKPASSNSKPQIRTPNKFKPYAACNSAEKKKRVDSYRKVIRNLKRQNERLQIRKLIEEESIEVDDTLDSDLNTILEEESNRHQRDREDSDQQDFDFQLLFLQQQLEARKRGPYGMRWHPLMIRFALQLRMLSPTAYTAMTSNNFISMPSDRTLYNYSHAIQAREGCINEIIEDVAEKVKKLDHTYQHYHALSFDEVSVSEHLVQRKSTGQIIGYCKLNTIQEEFDNLEKLLSDTASGTKSEPTRAPPTAKKMLSFMVKGITSNVENVVASYCVSSLTKEDLYQHVWEVTETLEISGIKVHAFVCDGSAVNRGFFEMHPPNSPLASPSDVIFDTVNPYDPERSIFFISDVPHLIKTIRNCFSKSGRMKNRKLTRNGQTIQWSTIIRLFKMKQEQTLKKLHKLDAACVYLNSFSCMKVRYAARVLSRSVANAIEKLKWEGMEETCLFENF